jgi:nucleoside-diphosphate-sugar epimerase
MPVFRYVPGAVKAAAPRSLDERSRMDLQLAGKRAVVTGGSRGIGLAVARALVAEGTRVALLARDQAVLDAAAAHLGADGRGPRCDPLLT